MPSPSKKVLANAEKNAKAEAREKGVRDLRRSLESGASDTASSPFALRFACRAIPLSSRP